VVIRRLQAELRADESDRVRRTIARCVPRLSKLHSGHLLTLSEAATIIPVVHSGSIHQHSNTLTDSPTGRQLPRAFMPYDG